MRKVGVGQSQQSSSRWRAVYDEVKAFFSSGVFYIIIGCLFLLAGYQISATAHSAFVFLLSILGVALVLYGTGTNAAGSGSTGNIKVAVAGGAGVLALILGFGVVKFHTQLGEVFKRTQDYGVLQLKIDKRSSTGVTTNLKNFHVEARSGPMPLPLWNDGQMIEILVPIPSGSDESDVVVSLISKSDARELRSNYNRPFILSWSSREVRRRPGFNNEIVAKITKLLDLSRTEELPVRQLTEENELIESPSITPQ